MGLTTSLYTGLTGLAANSQMIDVTGNNIANVNTNAFKSSRVNFETAIAQTPRSGSPRRDRSAAPTPRKSAWAPGSARSPRTSPTARCRPPASRPTWPSRATGSSSLTTTAPNASPATATSRSTVTLTSPPPRAGLVQGYGVDDEFNVIEGVLSDITIPVGVTTIASPTTEVKFAGNLNAGGDIATQGSITDFEQLFSDAGATVPATGATALTALTKADLTNPFALGDVITISGATRGGSTIPDRTFEINAVPTLGVNADDSGTTLQDFADFLDDIFGLDGTATPAAGVAVTGGVLSITGNIGTANGISFDDTNLIVNQGTAPTTPLQLETSQQADGESTLTTFAAFDSLGNPLTVNLVTTLTTKDANGTQWTFSATAEDDTDLDTFLGTGTANFDTEGQFIGLNNAGLTLDRTDTGAENPLQIALAFTDPFGSVTSLVDQSTELRTLSQDGFPIGSLEDFDISLDGVITGSFTNGLRRTLGKVPIATFANNNGLRQVGGSLYEAENNSGTAAIVSAGVAGAGSVVSRALELSNVELSEEFVNLITASTGFSASSRVITTSDDLIQELLTLVR